jgi:outer membrane protein assembly factor BamB
LNKRIFFYSTENGSFLSQFKISASPNIVLLIRGKYLFWSDYKGNICLIDLETKKIMWKIRIGAEILNVSATERGLLISSLDNFIYLISIKTGRFIWKKRLSGNLLFNSIIDVENIAVVIFASEVAEIIDIESGKLLNQITIEDDNYFINRPLFSDGLLIFPTVRGIIAFADSGIKCPSQ